MRRFELSKATTAITALTIIILLLIGLSVGKCRGGGSQFYSGQPVIITDTVYTDSVTASKSKKSSSKSSKKGKGAKAAKDSLRKNSNKISIPSSRNYRDETVN